MFSTANHLVQSWHNLDPSTNTCRCLLDIILTSVHVSILAHRNLVLFLCSLTLNSKLVNRCFGAGYLSLACTFICKQNDSSSLEKLSLRFLYIELSCTDNVPLVNWYAFGDLGLFLYDSCYFVAQAPKMSKLVTVSALIFSSTSLESLYVFGISTFMTSVFTLKNLSWIKFILVFIFIFLVKMLNGDLHLSTPEFIGSRFVFLDTYFL